jgi:hypothetical protein
MNLDTVLMCAQLVAAQQTAALGCVDPKVQALIDELTPAPVEEPAEVAVVEAEAEALEAQEAPAAE